MSGFEFSENDVECSDWVSTHVDLADDTSVYNSTMCISGLISALMKLMKKFKKVMN